MSEETKKNIRRAGSGEGTVTDGDQEEENPTPEGEDLPRKKIILQAKKLPQRIKKKKIKNFLRKEEKR